MEDFYALEFSKIQNQNINLFIKIFKTNTFNWNLVVGEKEPYEYLIESIDKFINQDELIDLWKKINFENCSYRNLSGGIVAVHSGWKI